MTRIKQWVSSFAPERRKSEAEAFADEMTSFLSLAEDRREKAPHPVGAHALLLRCSAEQTLEVQGTLPRWLREIAREHRIAIVNFGWRVEGVVVNFKTQRDAAKFRILWDDRLPCVGIKPD